MMMVMMMMLDSPAYAYDYMGATLKNILIVSSVIIQLTFRRMLLATKRTETCKKVIFGAWFPRLDFSHIFFYFNLFLSSHNNHNISIIYCLATADSKR